MYQKKLQTIIRLPEVDPAQIIQPEPTHVQLITPEFDVTLPWQYSTAQLTSLSNSELLYEFDLRGNLKAVLSPQSPTRYFDSRSPIKLEPSTWKVYSRS